MVDIFKNHDEPDTLPTTPVPRIRVLLADDHAIFRQGVGRLLQSEPDMEVVSSAAGDGQTAIDLVSRMRPDVVLMDVNMRGMNGIEATRRITQAVPGVRVIGLSMESMKAAAEDMRRAGAVDFLTKDCSAQDLLAAIRKAAGETRQGLR